VYLNFYGLREEPFGVTPDPRFLFFGDRHREALASLNYGIHTARGFIALIAKPGMGKTTLLFEMLNRWSHGARTAFLFQTQCDSRELKRYLLAELGVKNVEYDFVKQQEQLHEVLLRETRLGRRVVIVIDEAQNLRPDALETVRLLSNFETQSSKLLHIVLAGQPQLAERLAAPALLQLRQRIAMWRKLEAFTSAEVRQYMNHRLRVAGYQGGRLFDNEAQQLIVEFSQGVPRTINHLCFSALSIGCALGKQLIDGAVMREVIEDQNLEAFLGATPNEARALKASVSPAQPVTNLGNALQDAIPQSAANAFAGGITSTARTQTWATPPTAAPAWKAVGAPRTSSDSAVGSAETKWLEERSRMTRPLQLQRTNASVKPAPATLQNPAVKRTQTDKHQLASVIKWLTRR
jgi:type II secretory pathway predicted ATPase ExeA